MNWLLWVPREGVPNPDPEERCCLHRGRNKMGARPSNWADHRGPESYKVCMGLGAGETKGQVNFEGSEVSL